MVSRTQKLGVVSIPVLATLAATFGVFGIAAGLIFESVLLETILNIGVILSVSVVVARISAKSFLQTGSTNVLLLGLAVFEFGFSATLGGFVSSISVAEGIAMYEMGALTSAGLHFASGILTYRGSPQRTTRLGLRVGVSYVATMIFVSILSILAIEIPSISALAQLGSISQRTVLSLTVVMLLASAFSKIAAAGYNHLITLRSLGALDARNRLTPKGYHLFGLIDSRNESFRREFCDYLYCFLINVMNALVLIANDKNNTLKAIDCTYKEIADKICETWGKTVRFMYDARTISTAMRILHELGAIEYTGQAITLKKLVHATYLPWGG